MIDERMLLGSALRVPHGRHHEHVLVAGRHRLHPRLFNAPSGDEPAFPAKPSRQNVRYHNRQVAKGELRRNRKGSLQYEPVRHRPEDNGTAL